MKFTLMQRGVHTKKSFIEKNLFFGKKFNFFIGKYFGCSVPKFQTNNRLTNKRDNNTLSFKLDFE